MPQRVTVLAVDDEPLVRALLRRVLTDQGFRVLEAGSGDEALSLVRSHGAPIDLLLTDIRMPGMSGWQLGREFHAIQPEAKILYMSGYSDETSGDLNSDRPGDGFVEKPFSQKVLLSKVLSLVQTVKQAPETAAPTASGGTAPDREKDPTAALRVSQPWGPLPNPQLGRTADTLFRLEWQMRSRGERVFSDLPPLRGSRSSVG